MSHGGPYVSVGDQLRVRRNGAWGEEKLSFLDRYLAPALLATRKKRDRVFVDLFAGPGLNQTKTGHEYEGSALRALRAHAPSKPDLHFTRAVLINRCGLDHATLEQRINHLVARGETRLPRAQIDVRQGDANVVLADILATIHPQAYAFVLADPTAPKQLPWRTIETLSPPGRTSMDFYVLFPLSMGLVRLCSWRDVQDPVQVETLNEFYGSELWQQIRRTTNGQARLFRQALLDHYLARLRQRWKYVTVVRDVNRGQRHGLYKMLFCTNDDAGHRIARWEVQQQELPFL